MQLVRFAAHSSGEIDTGNEMYNSCYKGRVSLKERRSHQKHQNVNFEYSKKHVASLTGTLCYFQTAQCVGGPPPPLDAPVHYNINYVPNSCCRYLISIHYHTLAGTNEKHRAHPNGCEPREGSYQEGAGRHGKDGASILLHQWYICPIQPKYARYSFYMSDTAVICMSE